VWVTKAVRTVAAIELQDLQDQAGENVMRMVSYGCYIFPIVAASKMSR
jgi:hypothetical protein